MIKPVPGYRKKYFAQDNGVIFKMQDGRLVKLKQTDIGNGYLRVVLNGRAKLVHRIIAMTYIGKPTKERQQVNHKDFNKNNNCASNLEWVSFRENIIHATLNNRMGLGIPKSINHKQAMKNGWRKRKEKIQKSKTVQVLNIYT